MGFEWGLGLGWAGVGSKVGAGLRLSRVGGNARSDTGAGSQPGHSRLLSAAARIRPLHLPTQGSADGR